MQHQYKHGALIRRKFDEKIFPVFVGKDENGRPLKLGFIIDSGERYLVGAHGILGIAYEPVIQ